MTHHRNRRSFAARTARGFMRLNKFSSADKPAPVELASAGTTGAGSGSISGTPGSQPDSLPVTQRGVQSQTEVTRILGAPPSTHSAGGGVCCVMLAAQFHVDRWATLAVFAIFASVFAVAIIRANRSSRPTTPPRGPFAGSDPRNNRS